MANKCVLTKLLKAFNIPLIYLNCPCAMGIYTIQNYSDLKRRDWFLLAVLLPQLPCNRIRSGFADRYMCNSK